MVADQITETWLIEKLSEWERNPRKSEKKDIERLKRQIKKHIWGKDGKGM